MTFGSVHLELNPTLTREMCSTLISYQSIYMRYYMSFEEPQPWDEFQQEPTPSEKLK